MLQNVDPQTHPEGFIRLALILPFLQHVQALGVNPRQAMEDVGVNEDMVRDRNICVHADLVYGLLNRFSELAEDRYLGIHVGETFDLQSWPPFAAALQSPSTLFGFFADFVRLVPSDSSSVRHSLTVDADRAVYRITRQQEPAVPPIQVTGFGAAIYVRLLQSVTGDNWDPTAVSWESRYITGVPSNYRGVETCLGPDPGMQLGFPVDWLNGNVALGSSRSESSAIPSQEDLTVVAAMRSALRDKLGESDLNAESVASLLGLQPVRLVKALKHLGTTIAREIKRLKVDIAKEKLRQDRLSVAEIGTLLGYSDKAHFTRFFRSQTGMTPTAYKNDKRTPP